MTTLSPDQVRAVTGLVLAVADDDWMIGHRGTEWLAMAPDLEEDLAQSSISQDELGHAALLYQVLEGLGAPSADYQVYRRPAQDWRHARFLGRPRAGWAEWVVRCYLYETLNDVRRGALQKVPHPPLQAALEKIAREEAYHRRHFASLMECLATGGEISRRYLAEGLSADWPLAAECFSWGADRRPWELWDIAGLDPASLEAATARRVQRDFLDWNLPWPGPWPAVDRPARSHDDTGDLRDLLEDMRSVRNTAPLAAW
jgi:ring-1,2-phenylacetyl-CoA epoxidase subunit PaaC